MLTIGSFLLLLAAYAGPAGDKMFTNVASEAGLSEIVLISGSPSKDYILETIGTGAAVFDFDNDGWQDLYVANGSRLEGFEPGEEPLPGLYRNRGDGTFEDVSSGSGVETHFWGTGVAIGDYDNDGLTDLYVTAWGANKLYRNRGDGTFEDVAGLAGVDDEKWGASAAFMDIDADGLLDLFIANYIDFAVGVVPKKGDPSNPCYYRGAMVMCGPSGLKGGRDLLYLNRGDGTFEDVTVERGIRTDISLFGLGVATGDYDRDGDIDFYVANDATPNQLYRNRGDGHFDEIGADSGVAYGIDGAEMGSMGTAFGDYDGDGFLDLMVTNFSHQFFQLFRYTGVGFFEDVTFAAGLAEGTFLPLGWATEFFDYDNDGDLDLFFANGHVYPQVIEMQIGSTYLQPNMLMRNQTLEPDGAGQADGRVYADATSETGPDFVTPRSHRAGGVFDFDRDGDLDIFLTVMEECPALFRNDLPARNHWASFRLVGKMSNRSGIGSSLELTAGGRSQFRFAGTGSFMWSHDQRVHFGLGPAGKIDKLEVTWPDGTRQTLEGLEADAEYLLVQSEQPRRLDRRDNGGSR